MFKTFFDSLTKLKRRGRLRDWIHAANSNINAVKQMLGLRPSDCLTIHTKGIYCGAHCTRNHEPRQLNDAACQQVVQLFQRGRAVVG